MELELLVIIVTAQGNVKSAVRAMKAEVVGFIEKTCRDEALIGAIESAMQRGPGPAAALGCPRRRLVSRSVLLQIADSNAVAIIACYPP